MTAISKKSSRALRSLLLAITVCALSLGLPVTGPAPALAWCGDCIDCCIETSIQCAFQCKALYGLGTPQGDACADLCMERQFRCLSRCEV